MLNDPDKQMRAMLELVPVKKVVKVNWQEKAIVVKIDQTRYALHSFKHKLPYYSLIEAS